jgi:hypothetical protein
MDTEQVRAWAKRCADVTRGRMYESVAWDQIAERGAEWELARHPDGKPYRGGPLMTKRQCFTNTVRTVLGMTAFDPAGCRYAEGFALSSLGIWQHHAWVVNAAGLAVERTWREPGSRYVGVTFNAFRFRRDPGCCQLADDALGMAWAPELADREAEADLLFRGTPLTGRLHEEKELL